MDEDDQVTEEVQVPTEEVPAVEAPETPEDSVEASPVQQFGVNNLLAEEAPPWLKAWDGDIPDEIDLSPDEIERLPDSVKALLGKARAAVLHEQKRQEDQKTDLATQAQNVEGQRNTMMEQLGLLNDMLFGADSKLHDLVNPKAPEGEQPDPTTVEGQRWLAERVAEKVSAEKMNTFLQTLAQSITPHVEKLQQSRTEATLKSKVDRIRTFASENPDFREYVDDIKKFRAENEAYKSEPPERIYWILKNERTAKQRSQADEARDKGRRSRLHGEVGSMSVQTLLEQMPEDTQAQLEWFRKNPEAAKRIARLGL